MAERCNGQGELVFNYVEGALSPEERDSFRRHLEQCGACQRLQADFQRVAERARLLPPGESHQEEERVLRASPGRFSWSLMRALPTVLVVGLIVAGVLFWTMQPRVSPPSITHHGPDGAEGMEPGDRLRFIFSKEMDKASVAAALRVEPALSLQAAWDGNTLNLTLPPDVQRPGSYRVSIGTEATDAGGNPLTAGASLSFSTAPLPDVLVYGEQVPWSADEVTQVQFQVDAGTYDFRSTPLAAAERDLGWMMTPEEREAYASPKITEEHLHRVIVVLPRVDGRGRLELTLERLGGKRDTDPWFTTYQAEYLTGEAAAALTDEAGQDSGTDENSAADTGSAADEDEGN